MLKLMKKSFFVLGLLAIAPLSHGAYINGAILFSSFDWSKAAGSATVSNAQVVASTGDLNGQSLGGG